MSLVFPNLRDSRIFRESFFQNCSHIRHLHTKVWWNHCGGIWKNFMMPPQQLTRQLNQQLVTESNYLYDMRQILKCRQYKIFIKQPFILEIISSAVDSKGSNQEEMLFYTQAQATEFEVGTKRGRFRETNGETKQKTEQEM